MQQKIVIRVQMNCARCRSRAMKLAAVRKGTEAVSIEGEDKDRLVVVGERVDSVALARELRKKLGGAEIVSVEEVKKDQARKEKEGKEDTIHPLNSTEHFSPAVLRPPHCVIYHESAPSVCSIL